MLSPYAPGMTWGLGCGKFRLEVYVVQCKRCKRDVPAKLFEYPGTNTVVRCCLCGELRRYRPTEVYLGAPHGLVKSSIWAEWLPRFKA